MACFLRPSLERLSGRLMVVRPFDLTHGPEVLEGQAHHPEATRRAEGPFSAVREKTRPVIEVKVTFVGLIQRLVGCREETIPLPEGGSLGGLIQELVARYGRELEERLVENGELAAHVTVLINGRNALTQGGLTARLSDGSQSQVEIVLLGAPLMGG